jgi:type II secretory pathway component GspD/PulD (secretin)
MSTTLTSYLLSAALLLGADKPSEPPPSRPACANSCLRCAPTKMVRVAYPVADLVIPIDQGAGEDKDAPVKPLPGGGWSGKTREDLLMKLLRSTIDPASWSENGGRGTMEFHPIGLGLVVCQTAEVQEQIADLLSALRRLQDLEVAVEIRLVSVSESLFERLGVDFEINLPTGEAAGGSLPTPVVKDCESGCLSKLKGLTFLSDLQLSQFLKAAQGDRRTNVMQAPKLTVFNAQKANISVTEERFFVTDLKVIHEKGQAVVVPKNEAFTTGFRFAVQPVVSADRRFVTVHFKADLTELETDNVPVVPVITHLVSQKGEDGEEQVVPVQQFVQQPTLKTMKADKCFQVADGKTAVMYWGKRMVEGRNEFGPPILSKIPYLNRLFRNVGYGREAQTLVLLITPRIIINEEAETNSTSQIPSNLLPANKPMPGSSASLFQSTTTVPRQ